MAKRTQSRARVKGRTKPVAKRKNFLAETALTLGAIQSARDLGLGRALTRKTNPSAYVLASRAQFLVNGKLRTIAAGVPVEVTERGKGGHRFLVRGNWDGAFQGWVDKDQLQKSGSNRNPEDIDFLNDIAPSTSLGHLEFTPDGIERYIRDGYVYRAFSNTQVFEDGYRMGSVEGVANEIGQVAQYVNPRRRRGRNPGPASDAVYEEFHGTTPSETLEIVEDLHVHGNLAGLGDLVHVVVELAAGTKDGKQLQLNAPDPAKASDSDIVRLTSNEDKSQLYFTGGDQQLDLQSLGFRKSFDIVHDGEHYDATDIKDLMVIGPIVRVMYRTEKAFDDFEQIDYHHLHGEDTKKYPTLLYDTLNDRMLTAGGEYAISPAGIVN